jgi:hypothetical protein
MSSNRSGMSSHGSSEQRSSGLHTDQNRSGVSSEQSFGISGQHSSDMNRGSSDMNRGSSDMSRESDQNRMGSNVDSSNQNRMGTSGSSSSHHGNN